MLPNHYKWRIKETKKIGTTIENILYGRGIRSDEQREIFLKPDKTQMHSPFLLNDMDKAIKRIQNAKIQGQHIVIYGDYDVDGVTSTSILYMFLKEQGYDVSYYIPNRIEEGYGLNKGAIEKISKLGQLIITVDTGIAATGEVTYGNELGIDIIITDHHECQDILPDAYCIINPKRRDTTYPFESLAGVGVTFKLIHALALTEGVEDKVWKYMDIVALGTVADVVTLEKENRIITSLGFRQMKVSEHEGIRALLDVIQWDKGKVTSNMIGYQMGPRINAAGRISDAKIGVQLLTTKDTDEAKRIANILDIENKKRQDMELEILIEAEKYIEERVDIQNEKIIIVAGDGWHHGVIGIVASRILGKYYKPTIILTKEEGVYSGSARSVEGFNIFEAINSAKDKLIRFGGHEMAAGLSLEATNLEAFRRDINAYGESLLTKDILTPNLDIDLEVDVDTMSIGLCDELESLEPFGVGNKAPLFAVSGFVHFAQKIGQDKHLKLALRKGNQIVQGIGFDKGYLADCLTEGEEVIVACEATKNVWNGRISLQLRIQDIISPDEKVLRSQYYLNLYQHVKVPQPIHKGILTLVPSKHEEKSCLLPYTEEIMMKSVNEREDIAKSVTEIMEVCYNKSCGFEKTIPYEWDFKSIGTFLCVDTSLERHIEQLARMIPKYVDCKDVYKYFRVGNGSLYLHKVVEHFGDRQMTEYKVLQILDIFSELELMTYILNEGVIQYTIGKTAKTQLEKSKRYMSLQEYAQSISNY